MRFLLKNRPRILVASPVPEDLQQMTTLCSAMGYYVDYFSNLKDTIRKFRHYRHSIVILDENLIPSSAKRLLDTFCRIQQNCMILVVAEAGSSAWDLCLQGSVHDIITKPLNAENLHLRCSVADRVSNQKARSLRRNYFLLMLLLLTPLVLLNLLTLWYKFTG